MDVEFQIEADITYEPARLSGPPDRCCPDESECDITEIRVMTKVDGMNDSDILDALDTQIGDERIIEDLWEDYHQNHSRQAREEYLADKWMEERQ